MHHHSNYLHIYDYIRGKKKLRIKLDDENRDLVTTEVHGGLHTIGTICNMQYSHRNTKYVSFRVKC